MTYFEDWNETISASFQNMWDKVIAFVPDLLAALVVLLIGLLLAHFLSKLVYKLVELTKVDSLLKKVEETKQLSKAGVKVSLSGMLAWIVKWFIVFATLMASADILNLGQIEDFFNDVVSYLPHVFVAVVILAVGLVLGTFVHDIIEKSTSSFKVTKHTAHVLAAIAKWAILIFSLIAALEQMQVSVARDLAQIIVSGFVGMMALALGLAFGLGGKEHAAKFLDRLGKK